MDREGFRNRLKQYKQAREENPGLKYWEWKAQPAEKSIPKYYEGTGGVTLKEKEDAFWRGDVQKMSELIEREGKQLTYITPESNLDEVVVTAKNLKKEKQLKEDYNNILDLGITAAGFIPAVGEFADAADAINQFRQGNIKDGFISTAATFLPFVPAGSLRKSLSWFLDNDEISGAVKDRVEKLFLAGANKINFDPEKHFSTRITPGEKYNLRDINRLAAHLEEYKELESEIATNPKLLDEFYRRFRVIRDPESTLQTFSEAFAPWQIPTETFYTGVPQHKLHTFASADNNHFWMSSSPHLVEEFAGRNGKRAMLTTLKDLDQVTIDAKGKPYYNLEFFDREHLLSDDIVDELSKDPTIGQVRINNVIEGPDINILPNGDIADTGKISNDLVILKNRPIKSIHGNNGDFSMWFPNEKYYAEGGEVTGPPTYEQWYTDITKYNPTILDNASLQWSIDAAKKDLHAKAMGLPGYAPMWNEYMRTLPKDDPDINEFVDELWENENPNNVGYNKSKNKYFPHKSPEGGKATIGPGFKMGSGSHNISEREAKNGVTKARLNQEARKIGKEHLKAVDQFLNYGQDNNPADTISPQIKMGLMDLRHQVGPLNGWHNLRNAVLEGDLDRIKKESTVTWDDNGVTKVDKRRKKLRDEKYWHY